MHKFYDLKFIAFIPHIYRELASPEIQYKNINKHNCKHSEEYE